jgi:GTP-binding protein
LKSEARVAIIGRPNVGKSTLFNRLMHQRIAITDPIPGATRDAVARECLTDSFKFLLLDTGGCRPDADSELERLAVERSFYEAERADLILFVTEAGGITGEDYLIAEKLRRQQSPVILVVNKSDSYEKELNAADFYSLGFSPTVFISAEHNRNIGELSEAIEAVLPAAARSKDNEEPEVDNAIKIAVLGRPNAGKSSLANRLSGESHSLVSDIAGTTRDTVCSNFTWKTHSFHILDTAGLRRKSRLKERLEYFSVKRAEAAAMESDVALLVIDVAEGLTEQDKKIADKIVEHKKPFIFVLNKWDLKSTLKEGQDKIERDKTYAREVEQLRFQFPVLAHIKIIAVSAAQGKGLDALLSEIVALYNENRRQVTDFELTEAMREWADERPPARRSRHEVQFRSLRQTAANPAKFTLRVRGHLDDSYIRYFTNRIREEFGFKSVPVSMEIEHV